MSAEPKFPPAREARRGATAYRTAPSTHRSESESNVVVRRPETDADYSELPLGGGKLSEEEAYALAELEPDDRVVETTGTLKLRLASVALVAGAVCAQIAGSPLAVCVVVGVGGVAILGLAGRKPTPTKRPK